MSPQRFLTPFHGGYALRALDGAPVSARLVLALRSFQLVEDARED